MEFLIFYQINPDRQIQFKNFQTLFMFLLGFLHINNKKVKTISKQIHNFKTYIYILLCFKYLFLVKMLLTLHLIFIAARFDTYYINARAFIYINMYINLKTYIIYICNTNNMIRQNCHKVVCDTHINIFRVN